MSILFEDSRTQLVADSKRGKKERDGKNRFQKRLKSHVASSVRQYNRIDMNELFKNNIITISIEVKGETDDYLVKISYGGFLDALKDELKRNNTEIIDLRLIIRSLIITFNRNEFYISFSNSKANLNPAAPRSDYGRTPYVPVIVSAYFSSLTSSTNY